MLSSYIIQIQYIYLLQEREFIKTKEPIYKIGKTTQMNNCRFNQYPKGSILLLQIICSDCDNSESSLIQIFKKKYKQRCDIGTNLYQSCEPNNLPRETNFSCDKCSFVCMKKGDWNRHLLTSKHIKNINSDTYINIISTSTDNNCNCDKVFKSSPGLIKHSKKCILLKQKKQKEEDKIDKKLIMTLIKENKEITSLMTEICNKKL